MALYTARYSGCSESSAAYPIPKTGHQGILYAGSMNLIRSTEAAITRQHQSKGIASEINISMIFSNRKIFMLLNGYYEVQFTHT